MNKEMMYKALTEQLSDEQAEYCKLIFDGLYCYCEDIPYLRHALPIARRIVGQLEKPHPVDDVVDMIITMYRFSYASYLDILQSKDDPEHEALAAIAREIMEHINSQVELVHT